MTIAYKLEMKLDQLDSTSRMPPFPRGVEAIPSACQGYDGTRAVLVHVGKKVIVRVLWGRVSAAEHELVPAGGQNDLGRAASRPHEVSAQIRLAARSRREGQPAHARP